MHQISLSLIRFRKADFIQAFLKIEHRSHYTVFPTVVKVFPHVPSRILKGRQPIPGFSIILKQPEKSGILYYYRIESTNVTALAKLFGQYLLQPIPFTLTFLLPLLFRLIARKYIWLSLPLAALAEVLLNWDSFCYYEARGLALLFTLTQLAVMAVFVWILQAAAKNSR